MIRLVEICIDGFGAFRDFSVELAPGLNAVVGMNEAGKSTLLHFVRRVFYGFPDGRSNANPYPPLAGGRHGGRLVLEVTPPVAAGATGKSNEPDRAVRYVLERYADERTPTLYDGAGRELPAQQTYAELFGAVPGPVYQSILGFSLDELQDLATLQQDHIQTAIYGAAVGVRPQALASLHRQLDQVDSRGKGRPRRLLQDVRKELRGVEEAIRRAADSVDEYDAVQAELAALGQQLSDMEEAQATLEGRYSRSCRKLDAWQRWSAARQIQAELQQLDPVDVFPIDGVRRLAEIDERISAHDAALRQLQEDRDGRQAAAVAAQVDERPLGEAHAIERLRGARARYEDQHARMTALRASCGGERVRIDESRRRIADGWAPRHLRQLDVSELVRDELRKLRQDLDAARSTRDETASRLRVAQEQLRLAEEEAAAHVQAIEELTAQGDIPDPERLPQLRDLTARAEQERRALEDNEQALDDLRRRLQDMLDRFGRGLTPAQLDALLSHVSVARQLRQSLQTVETRREATAEQLAELEGRPSDPRQQEELEAARRAIGRCRTLLVQLQQRPPWVVLGGLWLVAAVLAVAAAVDQQWLWLTAAVALATAGGVLAVRSLRRHDLVTRQLRQSATVAGIRGPVDEASVDSREQELHRRYAAASHGERLVYEGQRAQQRLEQIEEERAQLNDKWRAFVLSVGIQGDFSIDAMQELLSGAWEGSDLRGEIRQNELRGHRIGVRLEALHQEAESFVESCPGNAEQTLDEPLEARLARRLRHWERASEQQRLLDEAKQRGQQRLQQTRAAERSAAQALEDHEELAARFRAWLTDHGLPEQLDPETALRVLDRVDHLVAQMDAVDRSEAEVEELRAQVERFETEVREVAERLQISGEVSAPGALTDQLVAALERAQAGAAERVTLLREVDNLDAQLDREQELLQAAQKQRAELLQEAESADAKELQGRAEIYARRRDLLDELDNLKRSLTASLGLLSFDEVAGELEGVSEEELVAERSRLDSKIQEGRRARSEGHERRGKLIEQCRRLLADQGTLELEARRQVLSERLRVQAWRYAAKVVARRLFEEAKTRCETERQPEVVREAQRYFAAFTGGEWTGLSAPLGERTIRAVRRDHATTSPQHLSRGTREQLYLALRFGYVHQLARTALVPPILMDDIMVNFDPTRRDWAASAICELATHHQVIYFTCHPDHADCLRRHQEAMAITTLASGGAVCGGAVSPAAS